jgi:hypothetical protein
MRRRRAELFEQPSLVPMADMVTNTVGIMLFILIFVSLSAGGVVVSRHLPRERATEAQAVWLYCLGNRIVSFDPAELGKQLEAPLGDPSFSTANEWAHAYSARKLVTGTLKIYGQANVQYTNEATGRGARISKSVIILPRANQGEDLAAIRRPDSDFRHLLAEKNKTSDFFFFFVSPDSIPVFRAARDQATLAGFSVGWSPRAVNEPARISLSGSGTQARIQ